MMTMPIIFYHTMPQPAPPPRSSQIHQPCTHRDAASGSSATEGPPTALLAGLGPSNLSPAAVRIATGRNV
ncbi:hypothetical protein BC567DRAFT_239587, partial [Phyllosticta citribraziliensis]